MPATVEHHACRRTSSARLPGGDGGLWYRRMVFAVGMIVSSGCWDLSTAPGRRPVWDIPIGYLTGISGKPGLFAGVLVAPVGTREERMQAIDAASGLTRWMVPMLSGDCGPLDVQARAGLIFIAGCNVATAYDAVTGRVHWTTALTDHPNSSGEFAVDSLAMYLPDRVSGRLSALDVRTGVVRWTWSDTTSVASRRFRLKATVAARGKVYLLGVLEMGAYRIIQGGIIVEFDRMTGRELRRFTTPDSISDYRAATFDGNHRLIVANHGRSGIDAFDLDAWDLAWRVRGTGGWAGPWSAPAVMDGVAYSGWHTKDVVAVDIETGRQLWKRAVWGGIWSVTVCKNEVVAQHFALTWIDRRTGKVRASDPFEESSEFPASDLVTDGERVYVMSNSRMYAYRCE